MILSAVQNARTGLSTRTSASATIQRETAEKRKLTFKERQELNGLPVTIESCEAEIEALHGAMADPQFYQQPGSKIAEEQARLKQLESQLAAAYARWEALERIEC